jgi:hypothetical protein
MILSSVLKLHILLAVLIACIDSLNFFGVRSTRRPSNRKFALYEKTVPHPPDKPPSKDAFDKGVYFASPIDDVGKKSGNGEADNTISTEAKGAAAINGGESAKEEMQSTEYEPMRIEIDDATKELSKQAARNFFETVIVRLRFS